MASRKQQKEAARLAREQAVAQLKAGQARRSRMMALGGVIALVIAAAVVVIVVSSSNNGSLKALNPHGLSTTPVDGAAYSAAGAVADVKSLLNGIPESGDALGSPIAPVTITEYGDLVCPTCDDWAVTTEPGLITDDVRTGKVRLLYRGYETASGTANPSEYVNTQVAARSAGLQDKEWYYVMLVYDEQPQTINGDHAEDVPYVTSAYLQNRATQVPQPFNLLKWQENLTNPALIKDVATDNRSAVQLGVAGTPTIFVSGAKGMVEYDRNNTEPSPVPTVAQLQALIAEVS